MKNLYIYILFASAMLLGCLSVGKKSDKEPVSKNTQLPREFFLQNRVDNCDKAIAYMTHIFKPHSVEIFRYEVNEVNCIVSIPGESKIFSARSPEQRSKRLLHLAPNCFVGMQLEDALSVFCTEGDKEKIIEYKAKRLRHKLNKTWYLYVNITGGTMLGTMFYLAIDSSSVSRAGFTEVDFEE